MWLSLICTKLSSPEACLCAASPRPKRLEHAALPSRTAHRFQPRPCIFRKPRRSTPSWLWSVKSSSVVVRLHLLLRYPLVGIHQGELPPLRFISGFEENKFYAASGIKSRPRVYSCVRVGRDFSIGIVRAARHASLRALYNFACWLTQDREEAEDLVQETYAKALKGFLRSGPEQTFAPGIYKILRKCFSHVPAPASKPPRPCRSIWKGKKRHSPPPKKRRRAFFCSVPIGNWCSARSSSCRSAYREILLAVRGRRNVVSGNCGLHSPSRSAQ